MPGAAARADLTQGLKEALSDVPLRQGYVQAEATWTPDEGALGRLEAGLHPLPGVSVFGFGQWGRLGPSAGAGARWEFDL